MGGEGTSDVPLDLELPKGMRNHDRHHHKGEGHREDNETAP